MYKKDAHRLMGGYSCFVNSTDLHFYDCLIINVASESSRLMTANKAMLPINMKLASISSGRKP